MRTWIVATAVATAALLLADRRGWNEGRWIAKPLASLGFILVAVAAGATGSEWGRLVLAGLVLGAIGDVLLLPKSDASFTAGLASFLLGHLLFAAAFLVRGVSIPWLLTAAALFVAPALAAWAWLRGRVPPGMGTPVRAYISVISAMVACAAGTFGHAPSTPLLVGALLFAVSDLAVARDRFVAPGFLNRAWGTPAYYAGQVLIAASTAGSAISGP